MRFAPTSAHFSVFGATTRVASPGMLGVTSPELAADTSCMQFSTSFGFNVARGFAVSTFDRLAGPVENSYQIPSNREKKPGNFELYAR